MVERIILVLELLLTVYGGTFFVFHINLWEKVHEPGGFQHELSNWQGLLMYIKNS